MCYPPSWTHHQSVQKAAITLFEQITYFVAWILSSGVQVAHLINPKIVPALSLADNVLIIVLVICLAFSAKYTIQHWKKSV